MYCYNDALDKEFDRVVNSSKNSVDIGYINALINLQRATKITAINNIADMANWWAKGEVNKSADELMTSLNLWSHNTWERTEPVVGQGNNGGGGNSW